MAKIQHKDLPDQYLHEPKGAGTAGEGTVYVADGKGAGGFQLLPVSSLDFDASALPEIVLTTIPTPASEDGTGLAETANGTMTDVSYVSSIPVSTVKEINKNFKELYTIYQKDVEIHTAVKNDVEALASKLNSLINTLKTIGLIANE